MFTLNVIGICGVQTKDQVILATIMSDYGDDRQSIRRRMCQLKPKQVHPLPLQTLLY